MSMFIVFTGENGLVYIPESMVAFQRVGDQFIATSPCKLDTTRPCARGRVGGFRLLTSKQVVAELNQREPEDAQPQ
jgi:hypothetical protein